MFLTMMSKDGDKLSPPCEDTWRCSENKLLNSRGHIQDYPVNTISKGRAIQIVDGKSC